MPRYDVAIIGGGAAGLNAALMLGRACRTVLVCDDGQPRNAVAKEMHGFLSRDGTSPATLLDVARSELRRYPSVTLIAERVERVQRSDGGFFLHSTATEIGTSRRLLLAHGVRDCLPDVDGLGQFWGRSVFVCPFCDGWEVRGQTLAVYGNRKQAIDLAQELHGWSKDIVICTPSAKKIAEKQRHWLDATNTRLIEGTLARLLGAGETLESLQLEDGGQVYCDALFLTAPLRQKCSIAEPLGCRIDDKNSILVDDNGRTNVPGCYAAGDAANALHQVVMAAASGARAAVAITLDLLREEADEATDP